MREYGTDILSHDVSASASGGFDTRVRFNNTFKSSVMPQQDDGNNGGSGFG